MAAGARFDLINIMAFDYGLTNAADHGHQRATGRRQAQDQLKTLYG